MKVMSFDKYLFFLAYLTKILIFWGDNNHPIIIIIKVVLIQMNDLLWYYRKKGRMPEGDKGIKKMKSLHRIIIHAKTERRPHFTGFHNKDSSKYIRRMFFHVFGLVSISFNWFWLLNSLAHSLHPKVRPCRHTCRRRSHHQVFGTCSLVIIGQTIMPLNTLDQWLSLTRFMNISLGVKNIIINSNTHTM